VQWVTQKEVCAPSTEREKDAVLRIGRIIDEFGKEIIARQPEIPVQWIPLGCAFEEVNAKGFAPPRRVL